MDSHPPRWTRRSFLARGATSASLLPLSAAIARGQETSRPTESSIVNGHFADYQSRIYERGILRLKPGQAISIEELEAEAKKVLSPQSYHYAAGGAGAEDTLRANLSAFKKWSIVPRVMRDISRRDYSVRLFNTDLPAPLALAPIGQLGTVHRQAEAAAGRAAGSLGLPMTLSTVASTSIEDVARAMGDAPRWFQLYWPNDQDITRSFLKRAEDAGYSAVFVTLDTRLLGWRERDLREAYLPFHTGEGLANYFSDPQFRRRLSQPPEANLAAAVIEFAKVFRYLSWTWKHVDVLRKATSLPIVLKGILHPDDARMAIESGVDGIVVSNHGGRQVDGAVAALDALPPIVNAVGGRIPVMFDSGIRRGADIVKALALGANVVLIGRPFIWGLAVDGEEGVRTVLQCLLAEFDLTMALSGYTHQSQLKPNSLRAG